MKNFNSPKLKYLYRFLLFLFLTLTFYRLCFLIGFKNEITNQSSIFKSIVLGFRFDLRLIGILIIPNLIFINLPLNPKFKEKLLIIFHSLVFSLLNFLYVVDAGYFSYLKSRVNSTVISFLQNPIISFNMVSQSYPWFKISLVIILSSIALIFVYKKFILDSLFEEKIKATLAIKIARVLLFVFVFALSLYGSTKNYPLRWSEAFNSPDPFSSNLSLNPILYIFDTYSFRKADYDQKMAEEYYDIVADFLKVKNKDKKKLNFLREYPAKPELQKKHPNVVVIIMESMAYYKTGLGGSKVNPTPYLDKLANESLLFNRFYTPTVATARSVFAAITSLPDISKVQTGTRNPYVVNQNTIMGQAHDYDKYYFIGGSANWGNIRGILSYNIKDLNLYEEGSYKSKAVDVWGISDLNLFKEASVVLDKYENTDKPFFAVIQSAGFHRPYSFPKESDDFKYINPNEVDMKLISQYGFESIEEFNAMRLQDFSLGKFFSIAKTKKWYDNTIFFVFGDHALPHNNALNVPEWTKSLNNGFHVPFVIHSPKYIEKGTNSKIASEMDVMPTIAGLIGIPYKTRALGRDLFDKEFDDYRAAFSYNWYAPFNISLVDHEYYYEQIPYNSNTNLIKYVPKDNLDNLADKNIEQRNKMEKLTKGLLETSKYLLYNNPKI